MSVGLSTASAEAFAALERAEAWVAKVERDPSHGPAIATARDDLRTEIERLTRSTNAINALLVTVHERIGGVGLDIQTFGGDHSVEIRWRRDYGDAGLSDERFASAPSLSLALEHVIAHEDAADEDEKGER